MRGRRLYGFVAIFVLVVGTTAYFVTRNTRHDVRADDAAAPGFNSAGPSGDDAPFQFAEPTTTAGPTTIPGLPDPFEETTTTTTTTTAPSTTSTTPSTTTSTTIPPKPLTPDASSIKSVCGLVDTLQSASNVFVNQRIDAKTTLTAIGTAMARYASISPKEIKPDATVLRTLFDQLVSTVEAARWNVTDQTVVQAVDAIKNQVAPYQTMQEHVRRIQFYEAANCNTGLKTQAASSNSKSG